MSSKVSFHNCIVLAGRTTQGFSHLLMPSCAFEHRRTFILNWNISQLVSLMFFFRFVYNYGIQRDKNVFEVWFHVIYENLMSFSLSMISRVRKASLFFSLLVSIQEKWWGTLPVKCTLNARITENIIQVKKKCLQNQRLESKEKYGNKGSLELRIRLWIKTGRVQLSTLGLTWILFPTIKFCEVALKKV